MDITITVTAWQVKLLIKILKNYLKLRKKIYYTSEGGYLRPTYHPEAIVIEGLIPWLEEKLNEQNEIEYRYEQQSA